MPQPRWFSLVCGVLFLAPLSMPLASRALEPTKTMTLDVQEAEVRDVLRVLAETGGVNIVTSGDVQGTLSTRLRDVPWEQALTAVLQLTGLAQERQGQVILVAPPERLRQARQAQAQAQKVAAQAEPRVTHVVPLHYAKASEMQAHLAQVLGACATISVDQRTQTLILQGTPTCLRAGRAP